jgi:hypothetical protein
LNQHCIKQFEKGQLLYTSEKLSGKSVEFSIPNKFNPGYSVKQRLFIYLHIQKQNLMSSVEKNKIIVELYELPVSKQQGELFGRAVSTKSLNEDDLIDIAVNQRTEFNRSTFRAVLDILKDVAAAQLVNGAAVTFGLSHYNIAVNGIFNGEDTDWDKSKHELSLRITPIEPLRKRLKNTEVQVRGMAGTGSVVNKVYDMLSDAENSRITPGGSVIVSGTRLKIAGDDAENGIYLVQTETNQIIRIPITAVPVNTPSKLGFIVPATLTPGEYKLSVTTQFSPSGVLLKSPRTYYLDYPLLVLS